MHKNFYSRFNETVYDEVLDNGMKVIINPKPSFNSAYGILTVDFGSINNLIRHDDKDVKVPAGIAHFLEHKMFDKKGYDISNIFAKYGSENNAFTSFNQTSYLFSATDKIQENIDVLFDLVQKPYFDAKKIAKEQGIIDQEILMYQDEPSSRLYFDTIANLYPESPLINDIAGSVDSIAKISEADLYNTYYEYYLAANLNFVLVGNIDVEQVMNSIYQKEKELNLTNKGNMEVVNQLKKKVNQQIEASKPISFNKTSMQLETPKVALGIRGPYNQVSGKQFARNELAMGIFLEMIFSEDSDIYQRLYSDQVINESFGYDFDMEAGYQFIIFASDTNEPEKFCQQIMIEIKRVLNNPKLIINQFELIKNEEIGDHISMMNSVSATANQMGDKLNGYTNLFDEVDMISEMNFTEVIDFVQKFFADSSKTINIIE